MVDAGALEMFVDADSNYTPDNTYFNISKTDPHGGTHSSSSNLQKMKAQADGSTEQTSTTTDTGATDGFYYWFWNGTEFSKTDIAETMHIVSIWQDNCPKTCKLWIQIGGDTPPINVSVTHISALKALLNKGLVAEKTRQRREELKGCYTPSAETPKKNFDCVACDHHKKSTLSTSSIFQDWHNDPDRAVSTSGHDILHTDNSWLFLPEYISKKATTDLMQKIFAVEKQCPSTCKLLFHGGTATPLEVNDKNESQIRSIVQGVKDNGAKKGITLCCAIRTASIDSMYDAKTNTLNCKRCSAYVLSSSGANDARPSATSSTPAEQGRNSAFYSSHASPDFGPSAMHPSGSRWSSADDRVSPYVSTMSNEALCGTAKPPTQQRLYGNAQPERVAPMQTNDGSCANNANKVYHQHTHTFTNGVTGCGEKC